VLGNLPSEIFQQFECIPSSCVVNWPIRSAFAASVCRPSISRKSIGPEGGNAQTTWRQPATTPDATHAFELAAVEVVGRDANQRCDLFAAHLAKFRQQGDEARAALEAAAKSSKDC
jgi:hypothetical protein